ncbi:MAG: kinase-like domain-containing protein [Benniella sp.]|nr:MAG: kinase-like domain-containing protein [Benniella sp.]
MKGPASLAQEGAMLHVDTKVPQKAAVAKSNIPDLQVHSPHLSPPPLSVDVDDDDDTTALEVAPSWHEQPVRLPTYTPSIAAAQDHPKDDPPTSPVDDPIHLTGSKKHFGFSARQSIASSIFPWQKHKPAVVFHQYSPSRPPLSKRSSLFRLKRVLPNTRVDSVQHLEDEELDLLTLKDDELAKRTLELLHKMNIQDWAEVTDHHQLNLLRISGAMTNCVFLVTGPPATPFDPTLMPIARPRKILLRVYGIGLESLISRDAELQWLRNLSTMEIGPSLLGIFKNGRFEEYVESTTLTKEDIRDPRTSRHIAHRMCELHNIVNMFPPPQGCIPQTKGNILRWIPLAREAIQEICKEDPEKKKVMDEFDFEKLVVEIEEVHRELTSVHSPLVFAHNDTQYGNILRTKDESGELVVIDFEYAGYNTRGFDIGNHFCEWTADYHSERPSILHPGRYPTREEQLNFLEAYVEAEIAMSGYHLTAINLSKYAKSKKRMSLQRIANGLTRATLSAIQVTSAMLKRRASSEIVKEDIKGPKYSHNTAVSTTAAAEGNNINDTTVLVTNGAGGVVQRLDLSQGSHGGVNTNISKGIGPLEDDQPSPVQRNRYRAGDRDGINNTNNSGVSKQEILDSMYKEVNKFALTSHIMWGLWGLIQATQSEIDFDYFEYALQRLGEFRRRRDEFMSL